MRNKWVSFGSAVVIAGLAITASLVTLSSAAPAATVHVIEHATTDTVVETGTVGDTTGDLLTFHNDVYDATNSGKVATDQGDCIRIVTGSSGSWECRWVTIFPQTNNSRRGTITVEGPFYDTRDSTLAVTGGTGLYKGASGTMELKANTDAGGYDFIFRLTF
ncbi:MAG: allene oxide cyclase family protein [Actinomycetota bacterium]